MLISCIPHHTQYRSCSCFSQWKEQSHCSGSRCCASVRMLGCFHLLAAAAATPLPTSSRSSPSSPWCLTHLRVCWQHGTRPATSAAGQECSAADGTLRVVSLLINSFNISGGRISPFLGNLSFLRELDLGGNQLVGEIPAGLGRLIKLRSLNLSYNQLQGEIPTDIGQALKNLAYLNLGGNSL
jgi:hypothetical protein